MDATIIVKIHFSEKSCGTTSRVTLATALKHKNTFKTEKIAFFFKAVENTERALSKNQYNIRRTCCRVNRLLITSSTSQDKLCPGARLFFLTIQT